MSTNLYYYPVPRPHTRSLSKALKYLLSPKAWGHDGTLGGDPVEIGADWVPFLDGIAKATSDETVRADAKELIGAIEQYGSVCIEVHG